MDLLTVLLVGLAVYGCYCALMWLVRVRDENKPIREADLNDWIESLRR